MTRKMKTMLNTLLLEEYKRENKIPACVKLGTYGYWLNTGYRVRKGEPAKHKCKLWTRNGLIDCWMWTNKQVDKIENNA